MLLRWVWRLCAVPAELPEGATAAAGVEAELEPEPEVPAPLLPDGGAPVESEPPAPDPSAPGLLGLVLDVPELEPVSPPEPTIEDPLPSLAPEPEVSGELPALGSPDPGGTVEDDPWLPEGLVPFWVGRTVVTV